MRFNLTKALLLLALTVTFASCSSSKKQPTRTSRSGRVIVLEDRKQVRVENGRHDNGKHKGWYKNPNNPHHPSHNKGKGQNTTVIIHNEDQRSSYQREDHDKKEKGKGHHGKKGKKH
ncbi:hypothetical protein [Pontibacter liquoris]|uniref:hypothetical protein n=1 Tax=Pontibacter liquoris TaxID=2905677 RepID=UPI001FA7E6AC|nr:hypothetical protein [Pontibacter liquoris]